METTEFMSNAVIFFLTFFVLFGIPAILPISAFFILAPIGFWQLLVFSIFAIVLYIIALVILWFMIAAIF